MEDLRFVHPAQPRGAVFVYIVKALGERGGTLYGFSQNSRPGVYGGSGGAGQRGSADAAPVRGAGNWWEGFQCEQSYFL